MQRMSADHSVISCDLRVGTGELVSRHQGGSLIEKYRLSVTVDKMLDDEQP
jgi:hypothetical protein